ncbi:MAG TPA: hypothetical protein VGR71_01705 [Nitrospira sp.]|nr:hypothetical protein [Nitrospira sp.]
MAEKEAPELEWRISSVAMMRAPRRFRVLGEAIDSDVDFRPTIAARTFPPKRRLKGSFAGYAAALEPRFDPNEAEGCFYERDVTPHGRGEVLVIDDARLGRNQTHDFYGGFADVGWFASPERLEHLSAYLIRVADAFGAYYGSCSLNQMATQRIGHLRKNAQTWIGKLLQAGRVVCDPEREILDVHWWNYYGPAFVDRWKDRLDSLGTKRVKTPTGALVIWATETPFVYDPKIRTVGGYPWKRPFYEALGNDAFMWELQRQRGPGEVVPSWNDHHRAAGVDMVSLPSSHAPIAKARILPRVVVLKNAEPMEEPDE